MTTHFVCRFICVGITDHFGCDFCRLAVCCVCDLRFSILSVNYYFIIIFLLCVAFEMLLIYYLYSTVYGDRGQTRGCEYCTILLLLLLLSLHRAQAEELKS